ncbi:MAG: enoyl-CoA hydratase [Magnetovibrionaceae bacterium]
MDAAEATAEAHDKASELLLTEYPSDGIARLVLNRPSARNALSMDLMGALIEALEALKTNDCARVIILSGAGPAFCAGHDLKEVRGADPALLEAIFSRCSELMTALVRHPKPIIAEVHGIATAAGCQLVAACDLAISASDARFATPGVNIGLFCSTPMVALSRAVGRKQAMEMLLLGEMIGAAKAHDFGLINWVVSPDGLRAETEMLAGKIASKSPLTLKIGKEAFYAQAEMTLDDAYVYASKVMVENMLARDAQEGIDAFLEKRPPEWEGR